MDEEWGPLIRHDGQGQPVPTGTVVRGTNRAGITSVWRAGMMVQNRKGEAQPYQPNLRSSWDWEPTPHDPRDIMEYQVKKPKGLQILEEALKNLKVPTKVLEPVR